MRKLITLLAILLFATNLYSSDWKLIESFNYELENVLWVENEILLSSNKNSCYLIRNYDELIQGTNYRFSRIYHSSNKGAKWAQGKAFKVNDMYCSYFGSYAFSFSSEHIILPLVSEGVVGKIANEISSYNYFSFSYIGISRDTSIILNLIEKSNSLIGQFRIFEMFNENNGFILGWLSGKPRYHILSLTNDNWQTTDTMRLPNNHEFSTYPGIFASYRGENNIVVSSVREEEGQADEYFLLDFDIATKSSEEIFSSTELKFENFLFLDEQTGYTIYNSNDKTSIGIYKTTDGGRSWFSVFESNEHQLYSSLSLYRFKFYDEKNGIIPYQGGILMTRDGGETWTASPIETEVSKRNITATWVGSSIIADGRDGKLYRYQGDFFDIPLGTTEPALPLCNTFDNVLPVKLEWIPAGMATHYRMQVSKFEDFSEIDLYEDSINNNYFAISELDSGVIYFWRVQPYNSKEEGTWSESCSFTVVYPSSVTDGDSRFSVYPNPTSDILHIRTDELINRIELSDVLGNVVITHTSDVLKTSDEFKSSDVFKTSDVLSINVENVPAGMYFLKLYTASGEILVEKVIVGF